MDSIEIHDMLPEQFGEMVNTLLKMGNTEK